MKIGDTQPSTIYIKKSQTPQPNNGSESAFRSCLEKIKKVVTDLFIFIVLMITCCRYRIPQTPYITWENIEDNLRQGLKKLENLKKHETDFGKVAIFIRINKSICHIIAESNFPIDTAGIKEWYQSLYEKNKYGDLVCKFLPINRDGSVDFYTVGYVCASGSGSSY